MATKRYQKIYPGRRPSTSLCNM